MQDKHPFRNANYLYVLLARPRHFNIISKILRWWMGTPYSHAALDFINEHGQCMVFEAVGSGIRIISSQKFYEHNQVEWEGLVPIKEGLYPQLLGYIEGSEGKSYSITQILGIAIANIFKLNKNPFGNGFEEGVCSESVAWVLHKYCGYSHLKDMDLISPKDLQIAVEKHKESRVNP